MLRTPDLSFKEHLIHLYPCYLQKERARYLREREAREDACRENEEMRIRLDDYQNELDKYRESMVRFSR